MSYKSYKMNRSNSNFLLESNTMAYTLEVIVHSSVVLIVLVRSAIVCHVPVVLPDFVTHDLGQRCAVQAVKKILSHIHMIFLYCRYYREERWMRWCSAQFVEYVVPPFAYVIRPALVIEGALVNIPNVRREHGRRSLSRNCVGNYWAQNICVKEVVQ